MSLRIVHAPYFAADVALQSDWYREQRDGKLALRYVTEVEKTVEFLAQHPNLGKLCPFREKEFRNLRFFPLSRPFNTHILYYRAQEGVMTAARIISGFRDLPRRLRQPPGAE